MQIGDRIEVLRDDGIPARVIFDRVPETLRPRPTLSVTVNADGSGRRPVTLTYLTPGLGWAADYVALFDEANGRMDVQGWITLTNNSGTPYVNASTLLVAGAVGNAGGGYEQYGRGYPPPPPPPPDGMYRPGTESAPRERLGNFYLYPLTERTTIADKQTKQVSFLDVQSAPAARGYEYRNGWLATADQAISANTVLRFSVRAPAGSAMRCRPARCASISATRAAIRSSLRASHRPHANGIGHRLATARRSTSRSAPSSRSARDQRQSLAHPHALRVDQRRPKSSPSTCSKRTVG